MKKKYRNKKKLLTNSKSTKKNILTKHIETKKKLKGNIKYKEILRSRYQQINEKKKNAKIDIEEKNKYVPFNESLNICILSFHESVDLLEFKKEFLKYIYEQNDDKLIDNVKLNDIYTIYFKKKKKQKNIVVYDVNRDIYGVINGTKGADIILCLFKNASLKNPAFDELGYKLLSILKAQGLPNIIGIGYKTNNNKIKNSKNFVYRYFKSEFTNEDKIIFIDKYNDFKKLYNEIINLKLKTVSYKEGRGYMLIDSCTYNNENDSLYFKGFVKGVGFNVINPIHITNIGDYYIDNIYVVDVSVESGNNEKRIQKNYIMNNTFNIETKEIKFIKDFLNINKFKTETYNINFNTFSVQSNKKRKKGNDDGDDFNCLRPININDDNIQLNDLMTLKNKDNSEYNFIDNAQINGKEKEQNISNFQNGYLNEYKNIYNFNNYSENNINFKNIMNYQINNEQNAIPNNLNWSCIKEEKKNKNADEIPFFEKREYINEMDYLDNCNTYNNFNNSVLNYNTINHNTNNNESNETSTNDNESYFSDDESIKSNENINKLNIRVNDKEFEVDSEYSDRIYLYDTANAKERFKRYRSLESLRKSYVDVYEDLPLEYSRIFDYESYANLTKYSKQKYLYNCTFIHNKYTIADTYCVLVIKNNDNLLDKLKYTKNINPLILSSLLPFERNVTVLNFNLTRTSFYKEPIKSKDVFEIVCGFRHFIGRPIFSQNVIRSIQSKGKYLKTFKQGQSVTGSIYGFTTVTHSPVFLIKKFIHNEKSLEYTLNNLSNNIENDINEIVVASGNVLNCDCKRIILKRISLYGKIYKIQKKKVIIKNMFHNTKDIKYFKPVNLYTKFGLIGKIIESLGTHGKMKCVFNGPLKQHDRVFMYLYKRVYPKWFPLSWNDNSNLGADNKPIKLDYSLFLKIQHYKMINKINENENNKIEKRYNDLYY